MTGRYSDQVGPRPFTRQSEPAAPRYTMGHGVERAAFTKRHEREAGRPALRRLRVFALNPSLSAEDHGIAMASLAFEPLREGLCGSILEVCSKSDGGASWRCADLESPDVIMQDGYAPSMSDPRFHQQMVYAVAMKTYDLFRSALGREIAWSFDRRGARGDGCNRLLLRPHGPLSSNAWYDRHRGEIVFGYFKAEHSTPTTQRGSGHVFTCLSHDVIAHEMSHALIDGLRSHFSVPSHPDVPAFHEAFADLVAVFQHFTLTDIVRSTLARTRGRLEGAGLLVEVAQELGRALNRDGRALRTLSHVAMPGEQPLMPHDRQRDPLATGDGSSTQQERIDPASVKSNPHAHGNRLASAVFSAFLAVYERRSRPIVKLATGGTGCLPPGEMNADLLDRLTNEVDRLARQFLTICIRAVDYCPPVDVRYGDFLRALITADVDSVPDDQLGYRHAIIKAFGQHGIYGEGASSMGEDDLLWQPPTMRIEPIKALGFGQIRFDGDPARPVDVDEMRRQAHALGERVVDRRHAREFGLVSPEDEAFHKGRYELPCIESIRTLRRLGPDRSVLFETVAEVVQHRWITLDCGRRFRFLGGSTIILDSRGAVRYVIRKRVDHVEQRLPSQTAYMQSPAGRRLWQVADSTLVPNSNLDCHSGQSST